MGSDFCLKNVSLSIVLGTKWTGGNERVWRETERKL